MQRLAEGVTDFGIRLDLFTLMSNHYHWVLDTPAGNLFRYLIRYAGRTQREVAQRLGMRTGGAIRAQVARLAALIEQDGRLARRVRAMERRLDAKRAEAAAGVRNHAGGKPAH